MNETHLLQPGTKLEINTYTAPTSINGRMCVKIECTQKITFFADKYMKGRSVAMVLESDNNQNINAPGIEIYLDNKDLKKILEFLIETEK